jgi:hypothetical protein
LARSYQEKKQVNRKGNKQTKSKRNSKGGRDRSLTKAMVIGLTAKNQRKLAKAVKRARAMGKK